MNIENEFLNIILSHMAIVWIILAIIFALLEGITLGMLTIWFTVGSIISAVSALLGANVTMQVAIFFIVSLVLLIFTRPIFVKHLKIGKEKNVIQQIEGRIGIVTQSIKPFSSGLARVNGVTWTAITDTPDQTIEKGAEVRIVKVEGVKLIVETAESK